MLLKVLALVGSPRRGGNTDTLVETVLEQARSNGHETEKVHLYDHEIQPCIDCRGCKKGKLQCVLADDMQELYPRLDAADVLVLGSPVYWCGPTAVMKLLVDRLRPYFANQRLAGKRVILAAPAKDGPDEADLLVEMLRRSCAYLEIELIGTVLGTAYEAGEIRDDQQAMTAARSLGSSL